MTENKTETIDDLRRRAELIARKNTAQASKKMMQPAVADAGSLLQELRVHQIELEMQNEELRRSHLGLEASHARYFELYNLAPVGYFTLSERGLLLRVNLTFATLVDVVASNLSKRPFSQFVFRDDQDRYYLWRKLLFETKTLQECELRLVKQDGTQCWIRLVANFSHSQDTDGENVAFAVASDITESKRIEVELATANRKIEEASKAKSNFLANMSHELRTPLNTIIGFSEVMQDQFFGPLNEKQMTFVSNILNSGRHLLSLINDILDISKVEANKMELMLSHLNIAELCQGTVAAFSEKARNHQVELYYAIDSSMDGVTVVADGRKLKQILYNLVDNGIKFNRPKGSVSITVQKVSDGVKPGAVQIVVKDTGIGIADEDQPKLFLPFSQLTPSYYDKQTEGTGLGLALTKHLVELHGGTLTLRSEFGKGCRFIVFLPISPK
jgi:PAS domain S-box-containing protein